MASSQEASRTFMVFWCAAVDGRFVTIDREFISAIIDCRVVAFDYNHLLQKYSFLEELLS